MDAKSPKSRQEDQGASTPDDEDEIANPGDSGANDSASKRERFRRLAESRTNKAISAIAIIGNLSNRHVYEYEDAEVRKVIRALREAIGSVEERFNAPKTRAGARFKL